MHENKFADYYRLFYTPFRLQTIHTPLPSLVMPLLWITGKRRTWPDNPLPQYSCVYHSYTFPLLFYAFNYSKLTVSIGPLNTPNFVFELINFLIKISDAKAIAMCFYWFRLKMDYRQITYIYTGFMFRPKTLWKVY